jgi:hypothetical protein
MKNRQASRIGFELVTPEVARVYLLGSIVQKLSEEKINKMAELMRLEQWEITRSPVVIGPSRRLLNGHHRLNAVVRSGVAACLMVVSFVREDSEGNLVSPCPSPPKQRGPGDCLHDLIVAWVGEKPIKGCGCKNKIRTMNTWGPDECEARIDEILGWLRDQAGKRGWWKYAITIPGAKMFLKILIQKAINESRNASSQGV